MAEIKAALEKNQLRLEQLQKEWTEFPKDEDLKTAAKELADWEYRLELAVRRVGEQQALTEKERKKLDAIRVKVRELCGKCYLSPRLDLFAAVLESLYRYKELISDLQVAYGKYQNGIRYVESQREYREGIELDLDDIRYDLNRILLKVRELEGFLDSVQSFHATMREVLDYRKWFEFQLECQKTGEKKKELTDRVFFTFSGGEKAMAMYVPLFSAVVAKYAGARPDAPKLISLDEAFAGVDETNIRDMFRLMVEFEFNFMINSQILWGDYDTVPALAIYQLIRPENARFVSVIRYLWNGKKKVMVTDKTEEEV